jgi:hypothetical protein
MTIHLPSGKSVYLSAAVMLAAATGSGRVNAQQTCVLEDALPAAYAALHQPELHQPSAMWPEVARDAEGQLARSSPTVATHGQLLLGRDTVYLYHLPVFMTDPFSHPHNFQVILEAEFADAGGTAHGRYVSDRQENPASIYTAVPPAFAQTALFLDYPGHPPLRAFDNVEVFRNHFERPGRESIVGSPMTLVRLVHAREFAPDRPKPTVLSYVLFGRGGDVFLAHLLSGPPDFDQILEVSLDLASPSADAVRDGLFVTLTGRGNAVGERLRAGEVVSCTGNDRTLELRVDAEPYCEVGELTHVVGKLAGNGFGIPRDCPPS